jgi:phosphatidylinositol alpha-mannosyltransferase
MRIAIANCFLPSEQHSGVPFQVHHLANALVMSGHEVTVFSFSAKPPDARYELHQFFRPRVSLKLFPFVFAYKLARTDFSKFDVLNVHGDNYLLRTSTPVVRTFNGAARDELKNARSLKRRILFLVLIPLEWLGARRADHVVGISETTRASVPEVQTVIPCGVDLAAFHAGSKTERPTILFVGTEKGRKRGAWLAQIFRAEVLPEIPGAELLMVSDKEANETGIRRLGRVSNDKLAELYRSSWLFCLPSTYEGFGVPYIEAMAAQTAVVATSPNPGAHEVLGAGAYGAFVDDEKLGSTIKQILLNSALRAEMEQRGAERCTQYSWPVVAARYESLFHRVIGEKTQPK